MTWRGAALIGASLPFIAAGAAANGLYLVGVALLVVTALIVVVDGSRAPRPRDVNVRREHDEMLSVGAPNAIRVAVQTLKPAAASVRDECPVDLAAPAPRWRLRIPASVSYAIKPRVRGELVIGGTVVRAEGPLRLGWRQFRSGAAETIPVEADITAVRVYEALARRGQLAELGVRSLRLRTEGTEFERIREAVADDPLRSINWKATARTGRLMATDLMPERAQPVLICIDHGRLMGVGAGELTKLDHAINAALLLVHVALRSGDRAGLFAFADSVTAALSPGSGALQLRRFLDGVRTLRPTETEPAYDTAFAQLARFQTRRALLVIFTDIIDSDQARSLIRQCVHLRRRHVPLVVTVRDPALDDAARRRPERGRDAYARAVAAGLAADRDEAIIRLRRSGVDAIDADARTLSPRLVNRYLEVKRRARL